MESGFGVFLRSDIADHADDERRGFLIAIQKRDADLSPHLGTIFAEETLFNAIAAAKTLAEFIEENHLDLFVVGMADARASCVLQVFLGVANHGAEGRVDVQNLAFEGLKSDPNGGLREERAETALAFFDGDLCVFALERGADDIGSDRELVGGFFQPDYFLCVGGEGEDAFSRGAVTGGNKKERFYAEFTEELGIGSSFRRKVL